MTAHRLLIPGSSASAGSQRRARGAAVTPWTTSETQTHAITVQTIVSISSGASTPAPTAIAM